eukprot:g46.t1
MKRGTLAVFTQNLAVSGANQVLLNLLKGGLFDGHIVLISPKAGLFGRYFQEIGVSVRIGWSTAELFRRCPDVRFAVCNTIMTPHLCVALSEQHNPTPVCWIIHEWWPAELIGAELEKRGITYMDQSDVDRALASKHVHCAFICEALYKLFQSQAANHTIIYNGMPPLPNGYATDRKAARKEAKRNVTTFLCLGIVCPRKNQLWITKVFQKFARERRQKRRELQDLVSGAPSFGIDDGDDDVTDALEEDVRLMIVGARYERDYEVEYIEKIKACIAKDAMANIEIHNVTQDVDKYYMQADVFIFASTNEVTPCVLPEAMARGIPVITSDIAGIPEQLTNDVEGFVISLDDDARATQEYIQAMAQLTDDEKLRKSMGTKGVQRAQRQHSSKTFVAGYRKVLRTISPVTILVDMDGCLVDWDAGFAKEWAGRTSIDRSHYSMEECVPKSHYAEAQKVFCSEGFFRNLPPMQNGDGIRAIKEMISAGFHVFLCTSPITASRYCAQEKFEWVREHLGEAFLPRLILACDKTLVRADILIDDKPLITGSSRPLWRQILFDAPYNKSGADDERVRLKLWSNWRHALEKATLGKRDKMPTSIDEAKPRPLAKKAESTTMHNVGSLSNLSDLLIESIPRRVAASNAEAQAENDENLTNSERFLKYGTPAQASSSESSGIALGSADDLFPGGKWLKTYRGKYREWRKGGAHGSRGAFEERAQNVSGFVERLESTLKGLRGMRFDIELQECDDFSEVQVGQRGYTDWRRGRVIM